MKINPLTGNAGQVWETSEGKLYLVISNSEKMKLIGAPYKCICAEIMEDKRHGKCEVFPDCIQTIEMDKFVRIRGELNPDSLAKIMGVINLLIETRTPGTSLYQPRPSYETGYYPNYYPFGTTPYQQPSFNPFLGMPSSINTHIRNDYSSIIKDDVDLTTPTSKQMNFEGINESDEDEFDPYAPLPENDSDDLLEEDDKTPEYDWKSLDDETKKLLCETLKEEDPTECAERFGLTKTKWVSEMKKYTSGEDEEVSEEGVTKKPFKITPKMIEDDILFLQKNNVPDNLRGILKEVTSGNVDPDIYIDILNNVNVKGASKYFNVSPNTVRNYKKLLLEYKEKYASSNALKEQAAAAEYNPNKVIDTAYGKVLTEKIGSKEAI